MPGHDSRLSGLIFTLSVVMPVLDTGIHVFPHERHWKQWLGGTAWIAGSSPAMTK
jgi:hypothetical protein